MKGAYRMSEATRLSWSEICRKYPRQQVGLADVEWNPGLLVKSAIVKYSESDNLTRSEIIGLCAESDGKIFSENTTPTTFLRVGLANSLG